MTLTQTEQIKQHVTESMPLAADGKINGTSGATLHQMFHKDSIDGRPSITVEKKSPSLLEKFVSWFSINEKEQNKASGAPSATHSASKAEPVAMLPELEAPSSIPPELSDARLPLPAKSMRAGQTLTPGQMMEAASRMSDCTLEQILFIVLKEQMALQKENAHVADDIFKQYQNARRMRERMLEEIKDALAKDQNILDYCKTAQNIALVASFICGAAAGIASFGLAAPIGAAIGGTVGALFTQILPYIATVGPIVAGLSTAATKGATLYSENQLNKDRAAHEEHKHKDKYLSVRIDDASERLLSVAETDDVFKERLVQHLKVMAKMQKLIMQR